MQKKYNNDFTRHLRELDDSIPDNIKWTIENDIDFMADASKTSSKNFEEIAKLNNAAYKRPGAARYEAHVRGKGGRPNLQDSIDYMDEMQDMIRHRDDMLKGPMKELDEVIEKMQVIGKGADGYAELKIRGEALSTEIFKNQALQAKYMDRINLATENLRSWLPDDSPLLVGGSKLPADYVELTKSSALRDMLANPVDATVLGAKKAKILHQQLQQHLEVMAAVIEHHPEKVVQLHDAVKKYALMLDARQQNEVLDAVRKNFGETAADKMAAMFKGITNDPEILLRKFFKTILSENDFKKAIKALDDGNLEALPVKAKILREKIFNIAANKHIKLSSISTEEFLVKFSNDFKLKGIKGESRDTLIELLKKLEQPNHPSVYKRIFGERLGKNFAKLKDLMPDKVKLSLAKKLSSRIPLKTLDGKWTSLELGDSRGVLGADAVIGIAMTYYDINNIMMNKRLSPAEETRQLENAIVSNMPIVGDFLMGINAGIEAGFEGSYSKGAQAAAFLVIGIGGFVPGAQVPALVAGLGMAGHGLGTAAWDISTQKDIIWAWVASGNWDSFEPNGVFRTGKMVGLYDAKGNLHTFGNESSAAAENKFLLEQFIAQGDVYYHTPFRLSTHTSGLPGKTIRDSIYDLTEITILKNNTEFETLKNALLKVYPDFDVNKHLRKHVNEGRAALLGHIKEKSDMSKGKPQNKVAFGLYQNLKAVYDKAAVEAVKGLKRDAEAEYQAIFYAGEAKEILQKLERLEKEYRFPFTQNVDAINRDVLRYFMEVVKSPLEKHSIPRRRIDLAREYVKAYDITIRQSIRKIEEIFKKAEVSPPSKINPYNLSGYMEPDLERIAKLKRAYESAPKMARDVMRKNSSLDPGNPCVNKLYKKLVSNRVRWIHAHDIQLLFEEWAGRRRAAEEERDVILQKINDQTDARLDGIMTIPEYLWTQGAKALGNLYAWEHLTVSWDEGAFDFNAERKYLEATATIRKRMDKLDREEEDILTQLVNVDVAACLSKLTVRLRTRASEKVPERPVTGGEVLLHLPSGKTVPFVEASPGNYHIDTLPTGTCQVVASHRNYEGEGGSPGVKLNIVHGEPQNGQPTGAITRTIYMVPMPMQITIAVVDDQGNAVPAADVSLQGSNWRSGKLHPVDNSGHVVFRDVPPGTYQVFAVAPGYQLSKAGSQITVDPVDTGSDALRYITLIPFLSTVQVTVTDALDIPVKNARVRLGEKAGNTDPQGRVTFTSVPPSGGLEPYKVYAQKEGYAAVSKILEVSPVRQNEKFKLNITLTGGVPLLVTVIDVASGKRLSGATVRLSYADEYVMAASDADGSARFNGLTPGIIYISAALPGYQPVSRVEKDMRFAKAGKAQTAVIKLIEGMKITAYVKNHKGDLLAGGYISMDDGPFYEAPTGSREFTPVKEGKHLFRGRAKQFAEAVVLYDAKPKQKNSDTVSLKLLPGATVMVEIRNERGALLRGEPTKITLFKDGKPLRTAAGPLKLFANLEPGTYNAGATADKYGGGISRELRYTGNPPAFHETLQVILSPKIQLSTLRISVVARDDKGNPSMGPAKIEVVGPAGRFAEKDLIGSFSDLVPGRYTVTASVQGFISKSKTITISSGTPGKIYTLSFDLSGEKKADKRPHNQNKNTQYQYIAFDYNGCLNSCGDDSSDDCITSCLRQMLNYCQKACRGRGANCVRNCRKESREISELKRSEPAQIGIQDSIRTVPPGQGSR